MATCEIPHGNSRSDPRGYPRGYPRPDSSYHFTKIHSPDLSGAPCCGCDGIHVAWIHCCHWGPCGEAEAEPALRPDGPMLCHSIGWSLSQRQPTANGVTNETAVTPWNPLEPAGTNWNQLEPTQCCTEIWRNLWGVQFPATNGFALKKHNLFPCSSFCQGTFF